MTSTTHRRSPLNKNSEMNGSSIKHASFDREHEKLERENLVLWKTPFTTLYYFVKELFNKLMLFLLQILRHKKAVCLTVLSIITFIILDQVEGAHKKYINLIKRKCLWWIWWIGLGFLSSCGFGTGLHTFVLYLGPFIAEVTLGAYECGTTNFPEPPYPDKITCPSGVYEREELGFWKLVRKTELEAILWGLGTAIGELPPYFMARSARLSGKVDEEDEELQEFEEMVAAVEAKGGHISQLNFKEKTEFFLHKLIQKAGFIGILLCASIPNPLFDLAGMTCGHFLVPFWHFFGATFIGKAVVKVHFQQMLIVAITSEHYMNLIVQFIGNLPFFGDELRKPLVQLIRAQKDKLHDKNVTATSGGGWLPFIISLFVFSLMMAFCVSIIHAFAKDYHRRLCKWRRCGEGEITVTQKKD